jgi:hypothetical protein
MPVLSASLLLLSLSGVLGDDLNREENDDYASLPMLRLGFDAGLSHWIRPDDTTLTSAGKAYVDNQQQGQDLSVDAVAYFLPRGGFGLTWIWFLSRTDAADLVLRPGGPAHDLEERVSITYIGPSFWSRMLTGRYGLLHAGFGAGYLGVLDTWTDNGTANKVEAKTWAIVTSVGWDYTYARWGGFGINGRFVFSNIDEWTYNGEKVVVEDVNNEFMWYNVPLYRLELNAGLRFYL